MARIRLQPKPSGYTILVVDDEEAARLSIKAVLEREGHQILVAESGARALQLFGEHPVHLLLVDYFMPRMTGEELIARVREIDRDVQIVLQTGYSGEKPPREMLRSLDIQGYHDKTEGPDKLALWVDVALKAYEHVRRVREAEILKAQLLANVSHEFRTPLNVILGYLELLEDDLAATPEAVEKLTRVRSNAKALLWLVDDFLHFSDADGPAALIGGDPIDWLALGCEMSALTSQLVGDKPIRFAWDVPGGLPPVAVDARKLRLILRNLLANAVKFTDAGSVTVTTAPVNGGLALLVRDTGIGIPLEHHDRIFEPFHQVDGGASRRHEGAGIGLATARKLARLTGGDITVASVPGEGATFSIHLPLSSPGLAACLPSAPSSEAALVET